MTMNNKEVGELVAEIKALHEFNQGRTQGEIVIRKANGDFNTLFLSEYSGGYGEEKIIASFSVDKDIPYEQQVLNIGFYGQAPRMLEIINILQTLTSQPPATGIDVVERVARSICKECRLNVIPNITTPHLEDYVNFNWKEHIKEAKAAIAAMQKA